MDLNETSQAILNILSEDKELICYRKSLRKFTGSVTSAILLQQIIYWYKKSNGKPFYKFKEPCTHSLYREGDSWTEELGFSSCEFDTALKCIGTKITKGVSKNEILKREDPESIIIYWTDAGRVTWYMLNIDLLGKLAKLIYLINTKSRDTLKDKKPDLPLTETTAQTTTESKEESNAHKKQETKEAHLQQPISLTKSAVLLERLKNDDRDFAEWHNRLDEKFRMAFNRTIETLVGSPGVGRIIEASQAVISDEWLKERGLNNLFYLFDTDRFGDRAHKRIIQYSKASQPRTEVYTNVA